MNNSDKIPNSHLTFEASQKLDVLEKIFNGSILVYTINEEKKNRNIERFSKANALWEEKNGVIDKNNLKTPKEESAVALAQIVMIADDLDDEFKKLLGRSVMINSRVGKTYWLSKDGSQELTWIDKSAVYGLLFE